MSMYNWLEDSLNYSDTGSLWFYSIDEATNFNNIITNTDTFKSFKYKDKLMETQLLNMFQIKVNFRIIKISK